MCEISHFKFENIIFQCYLVILIKFASKVWYSSEQFLQYMQTKIGHQQMLYMFEVVLFSNAVDFTISLILILLFRPILAKTTILDLKTCHLRQCVVCNIMPYLVSNITNIIICIISDKYDSTDNLHLYMLTLVSHFRKHTHSDVYWRYCVNEALSTFK